MLFSEMIRSAEEILNINTKEDFEVNKLCSDSKSVKKGDIFFAVKGLKTDGNKFISDAVSSGAKAVFSEQSISGYDVPVFKVGDCRKTMAVMSNIYFGYPSKKMKLIGVTGTNGKTTVTYIINHILESAGKKTGLIGTNGNIINKRLFETNFTTPESIDLNNLLNKMYTEGVEFVAMEVSSHSLAMKRVYGLEFDTAVFTNLTSEHLDFHKSMEEYFEAKKILFDSLKRINSKDNRTYAVYNSDDLYGRKIVSNSQSEKISYGFHNELYTARNLKMSFEAMTFDVNLPANGSKALSVKTSLIGKFNVYNILASTATLRTFDIPYEIIQNGILSLKPVEGRFNQFKLNNGSIAVVDYSHTPDSLMQAILTIREILNSNNLKNKIITVFGCGGNRDKTKRPLMGNISARHSNHVIITSDNPRDEDPYDIIEDIKTGITSDNYSVEENRGQAIEKAIKMSEAGDVVLIAGKGHENYQEIKGVKHHLSDREIVERFL